MYSPLSPNFEKRIRESGRRKTVADVYYDGQLVVSDLPVSDGNIRVDLDGQVRRTGSITIADPRLVPTLSDILSPLGTEIRIRQGIIYPNGDEELVPLGVFRLEVTGWGERDQAPQIQLYDRSKALLAELPSPFSRAGWSAQAAIISFLEWFYPLLAPINPIGLFGDLKDYRLPGGHVFEADNHWDPIVELARNIGGRLYFDVEGSPKCVPIAELDELSDPVFEVNAGAGGVLVSADHTYSREGVFNAVTVVGAAKGEGVIPRGTIYNLDAGSPLRYGGPFGKAGTTINDSSLTTVAQCLARARRELRKYTGLSYSLDFSSVPNPALDAGDIVKFVYPTGAFALHQIASLSIPLGSGDFTGSSKGVFLDG